MVLLLVGCEAAPGSVAAWAPVQPRASREEFAGPFQSWTNVKTAYGAVGDGQADDTAALQRALTELGTSGHSPVLFVPAGRYRITGTLTLLHQIWLSVIGEDPENTSIMWDGPRGGTMLLVNGIAYSRINRLTFDGRRTAGIAIDQSFDNAAPHFDTGNEYADDVFRDVEFGIHGGFKDFGFAETSIVRARFIRNTTAGVALGNFNALDIWIWHSLFEDCATGITNEPGAGNYHVYDSVFHRSRVADLSMQNTGGFSARGNYSIGSRAFFVSGQTINHPASIEIQGNTIIDPLDTTAIRLGNQGPGLVVDNTIRSLSGAQAAVVWWKSFFHGADVVSVGNTFTVPNSFDVNGRHVTVDDRVVARDDISVREPVLPATLENRHREIFEVPRGANAAAIQALVDRAVKTGNRAIVHVPFGEFNIDRTIVIPPSDVQMIGDGSLSILKWTGNDRGPVIAIDGPTRATLRDLRINAGKTADGIEVSNVDQKGARLYFEGVQVNSAAEVGLHLEHVNDSSVEFVDMGHGFTPGISIKIADARATIFSGASAGNSLSYDVSDGGDLLVSDMWYEGDMAIGFARVRGSGRLTMRGLRVAGPADRPLPAIDIANLEGTVALINDSIDDRIAVTGQSPKGRVLALGLTRPYRTSPFFVNSGGGQAAMLNSRQSVERETLLSSGTVPLPNMDAPTSTFLREMLERSRGSVVPARLASVPDGVTDLGLYRVLVDNGLKDMFVTGRTRQ
ncbi:MAG TPA: glycosyl hydrolase family 28-related protein [Vicinamibacterales bacterium]